MHRVLLGIVVVAALALGGTPPARAEGAPPVVGVQGDARDGGVLTADADAIDWSGQASDVRLQWLRDGKPVDGATAGTYRLGAAAVGHRIAVRITAAVAGADVVAESAPRTVQPGVTSERRLAAALVALRKHLPGRYTYVVRELDGGRRTVKVGAATHREPASVYKLFIAYGVFTDIDEGRLRSTDRVRSGLTVRACLRAMIEPSDNYCAQDLMVKVGVPRLNRLLHSHGLTGTTFWYDGHRTKTTTAEDITDLLDRLARGKLVSKASTATFVRLLETHVWREAIPPGLRDGVRQASKPGTLYTSTGYVQTDSAIVWGPRSRYVLTVMGSNGATTRAITRISAAVYRELQGPVGKAFHYDRQQMSATGTLVLTTSVARSSRVLGRYPKGTRVEVIDSMRTRYLVRIAGRVGWIDNDDLTLRHPIL